MDLAVIIAVIVGPILAVQAQKLIEKLKQKRQAKEAIFKTLMSTRGARLAPDHVRALNMIDIEFHSKRKNDKKVVEAWRIYLDQLHSCPRDHQDPDYRTKLDLWSNRSVDVFNDMLFEMASSLNYDFDKVLLKRGAYIPTGYGEAEQEQWIIRKGLVDLSLGYGSIPIRIVDSTSDKKESSKEGTFKPSKEIVNKENLQ